jgi:CRP-like cAMP-binding protein
MFEKFEQYLRHHLPELTDEQINRIRLVSVVRKVRRKHFLLHEGEVSCHKIFVVQGLLKTYSIAEDDNEYIIKFTPEHKWTTDPESYINRTPSKYNIEAIEAAEVVLWSREDLKSLRAAIPAINAFLESMMAHGIAETQKRLLMNISSTAEERYLDFITSFPNVFRRVPLHMVASYLGVSRETLTRIRHLQLSRKSTASIG